MHTLFMHSDSPTAKQFLAYDALFAHFNNRLFGGKLRPCILNFSRAAKAYGFFAPERWSDGEDKRHEISINPGTLKLRTPREVCSTLVHEMVHLWQADNGKPGKRGYHNQQWADMMVFVGLMPSDTGAPGGNPTGTRMTHYIIDGGAYDRAFAEIAGATFPWTCIAEPKAASKARNKVAYECPGCGAKVWGKSNMRIQCIELDICDVMIEQEA
jgi:predicted SprT family Zn-dependent metalloprotease